MASKPRSAELHPGPGFRVRMNVPRLPRALMNRFRRFPTPDVSDLLNRLYAVDPLIHCLTGSEHQLCGPACTVKVYPGDNLMVHKALDVAEKGDDWLLPRQSRRDAGDRDHLSNRRRNERRSRFQRFAHASRRCRLHLFPHAVSTRFPGRLHRVHHAGKIPPRRSP